MALAIEPVTGGGSRETVSRGLGVAALLYGLIALASLAVAGIGLFGLLGASADPGAAAAARMMGLPWSLAAQGDATTTLLVTGGALTLNTMILAIAARWFGRVRR